MNFDFRNIGYRIAQDDHSALRELYDHLGSAFFELALAIVHSAELAEEIVEDVFIQVWKKRSRISEIENLQLYLYIAVRNTSRSYLRKIRNRQHLHLDDIELPYYKIDLNPEELLISGEIIQRINEAINALPPKCRIIFKLIKEDGLKYREVAELLHLNVKTVENQMAIALRKIHLAVRILLHT